MAREPYSDREINEVVGSYPPNRQGMEPETKYYKPITPEENFKMFLEGKTPYWIPRTADEQRFRPRLHPDNVATRLISDGEPPYEYDSNVMRSSWFDLDWEYVPSAGGATVHPGNPKVPDITRWEEFISMPDLEKLDWEACERNNKEYLSIDKLKQLGILSGFWERLISLCDVDAAAIAMIDEDAKDSVHNLFDKLADMHIEYITRINEICNIDIVLMHDDWGHQNAAFFSLDTAREMLVPYLKRVTDHCHKLGLFYEHHSCGKCEILVPAFIEAGVDLWVGQTMNDYDMLLEKYQDSEIAFRTPDITIAKDASENQIRELAEEWVEKYKNKRAVYALNAAPAAFTAAVYEYGRKAYQDA